jgi:hypothetical protein
VIEPCPGVAGGKRIIFWPARNRLRIGRRPTEADGIHAFQQALADQGHPILGYFSRSKPPKPPTVSSAECLRARREANWLRWPKRTPSGLPSSVSGSRRPRDQKARPSISPRPAALPTRVGKACLTVVSIGIFTQFLDRDQFPSTGHVGFTERCGPFSGKTRPAVILHCHGVLGRCWAAQSLLSAEWGQRTAMIKSSRSPAIQSGDLGRLAEGSRALRHE